MKVDLHQDEFGLGQQKNRFVRLGAIYIVALSAIALVALAGQALIQVHLSRQLTDSKVVNIAGRQRMLSQQIAKSVLKLDRTADTIERAKVLSDLAESLRLWQTSQGALVAGSDSLDLPGNNTREVQELFLLLKPSYEAILKSAWDILAEERIATSQNRDPDLVLLADAKRIILGREPEFLAGMNSIVEQYAKEASSRVSSLSFMEYVLVIISLSVIVLETIFVFRPTAKQVNQAVDRLTASEKNAHKLSKEIGALYASLEKSYQQMAVVNQPAANPRLFAKADRGGNITFVSDLFKSMTQLSEMEGLNRFCDLFPSMKDPDDWMDEIIDRVSEGTSWRGELSFTDTAGKERWVDVVITPVYGDRQEIELVMAGAEITHHKLAERSMSRKNMAEIEKTINRQKFRSVLILEGQEEERKRIAMDIHDGIGQMLTSLKFQFESIDLKNEVKAEKKIREIEQLIKDVIKEVRRVTFNLKPTVLGDYGLQAGLNVFMTEIGKLTNIELVLDAQGETERLPQKIENNIFRIIQEAINNAIKYSEAPRIDVIVRQSETELTALIRDEGRGFDTRIVDARSVNIESGRGFFNMYERTEYANGYLEINSSPGKGTSVQLKVPIHKTIPQN